MIDFSELLGVNSTPTAPDFLEGYGFCPILRGTELWFGNPTFMVKGAPPIGTHFKHSDFHIIPADFGPIGTPIQIEPHVQDVEGNISMRDQFGSVCTSIDNFQYKVAELMAPSACAYFKYPDLKEGEPQMIAVFLRASVARNGYTDIPFPMLREDQMEETLILHAFIAPKVHSVNYYLTTEEREEMIPVFGGTPPISLSNGWED